MEQKVKIQFLKPKLNDNDLNNWIKISNNNLMIHDSETEAATIKNLNLREKFKGLPDISRTFFRMFLK